MTFGKHQEGQLGRNKEGKDDSWHMVPKPITGKSCDIIDVYIIITCNFTLGLSESRKAKWVGARGNQTFVVVDELLVPEGAISQYKTFATSQVIGKYCIQYTASHSSGVRIDSCC